MKKESQIRVVLVAIVVLLLVNVATILKVWFIPSHEKGCKQGMEQGQGPGRFLPEKLDFDESQNTQFEVLRDAHHQAVKSIEDSIRILKNNFFGKISEEKIDTNQLIFLSNIITEKHRQIDILTFWHFKAVYNICNEKQKPIFENIIKEGLMPMQQRPRGPMRHLKN